MTPADHPGVTDADVLSTVRPGSVSDDAEEHAPTPPSPNLVLTGFMATGKSAVGRLAAERLGVPFVDMDTWLEARLGTTISEVFRTRGEAFFRDAECEAAATLGALPGAVIATGGGTMLREANRAALAERGVVVCLRAAPATIARRLAGTGHRPLLGGAQPPEEPELIERARTLLAARRPIYDLFPLAVETDELTAEEVAERVIALYRAAVGASR